MIADQIPVWGYLSLLQPIAGCFGHNKKAPALEARASYPRRKVLPLTKRMGPARQKAFRLFAAYLRGYRAKISESAVLLRNSSQKVLHRPGLNSRRE
jgi:hypothetical protein